MGRTTYPQAAYVVAAGTIAVLVTVSVVAATLCSSVIDFVTVRVVVVVQNTVAGNEDLTTFAAATFPPAAAALDVSERIGVKLGEVGTVVVPFVFVLVIVVTYSVRVVVTVKAVVYVGTGEVFVLPSWVEQDAAASTTMRGVFWKRMRRRDKRGEGVGERNIMVAVLWSFC